MSLRSMCPWTVATSAAVTVLCVLANGISGQEASQKYTAARVSEPTTDPEEYGRGVRTTEPRTPQDELNGFHLHPGLSAHLVASDPIIAKPLNMAFDWKGRLWVTQTYEYPYPYDPAKDSNQSGPRDSIVILEDVDGDGYREKVTTFADKLNIPIGLLPYKDGVICFSIPNIMFLRDTDGDSVCDHREVILGPFDTTRDTHGMVNSLRWSPDGWVIANHGFNNNSVVSGRDGKKVTLTSGNVFRFRPDGSSIELYAQGQVNPFGMTIDPFGEVFTADCHSKPISQVIHGGCYQSFGRPHDGLGFVPDIMSHLHGSTAIAGLEICAGEILPVDLHQQFVSGNVMTSRINRNLLQRKGLTVTAIEQPDLLTSDDPWFRPVDIRLGPDGYLYVADFYNRIIGHYEVPLTHEGRDRFRGRIWRLGAAGLAGSKSSFVALQSIEDCIQALESSNPTVVNLALQRIEELSGVGVDRAKYVSKLASESGSASSVIAKSWASYLLHDKNANVSDLTKLSAHQDDTIASHALKQLVLSTQTSASQIDLSQVHNVAIANLSQWKSKPHAAYQASRLMAKIGSAKDAAAMLDVISQTKASDPMLHAGLRIELRKLLLDDNVRHGLVASWKGTNACGATNETSADNDVIETLVAIESEQANELFNILVALPPAKFPSEAALAYLARNNVKQKLSPELLQAMTIALSADDAVELLCFLEANYASQLSEHLLLLGQVAKQLKELGKLKANSVELIQKSVNNWFDRATSRVNSDSSTLPISWFGSNGSRQPANEAWLIQTRNRQSASGIEEIPVFSSFPLGETYTGVWTSAPFAAPKMLSFYLCGHNGQPDQPDTKKNRVDLIDVASYEVIRTAYPPRNDTAQRVQWDLSELQGRLVALQVTDNDSGTAYAWLAIGDFEPASLSPNSKRVEVEQVLQLIELLDGQLAPEITSQELTKVGDAYFQMRLQLAMKKPAPLHAAVGIWAFENQLAQFGAEIAESSNTLLNADDPKLLASLQKIAQRCDADQQRSLVQLLSSQSHWRAALLTCLTQGWISNRALLVLPSSWWEANANQVMVAELSALRPDESEEMKQRFEKFVGLRDQIAQSTGNPSAGKQVFAQQCSACHQFAGQGKVVGPQLEGVGGRGLARLCEDVLMPNQNVDHAFHSTAILTNEGEVLIGLVRQRDNDKIVIADAKGEEKSIARSEIDSEKSSGLSLMPENFGEVLSVQQLSDLMAYLRKPTEAK